MNKKTATSRKKPGAKCDQCEKPCYNQYSCHGFWICTDCLIENAERSRLPGWVNPMKLMADKARE